MSFSIITPLDPIRLKQFVETKRAYDAMPQTKEFIIPTRNILTVKKYLKTYKLEKDVILRPYELERGFNVSKALNIGVRSAMYDNIIITSPEVKPTTDVLSQLEKLQGKNVICQVTDQAVDGNLTVLVSQGYRDKTPAMYFLAMFQKKDIEAINGWDEEFTKGYAYEDDDFGARWVRAGLPFEVHDEIQAMHQYHPRNETIPGGLSVNQLHYYENTDNGVIRCDNGMVKYGKHRLQDATL